ncbi:AAA family ATPase [Pedobacter sp. CFBP9032]|uniref:AAA family ATPase n=1 Tax=Pedobacter sp. CFBP9032 TaxID=3096539 RepID=UPI002A6A4F8B|nr:AAA family ATPase [Pedobacter sp. CFBP9032]MDY0903803.1 AAA family ATPase [Pedobacter sp. CFBP9032]
MKNVICIIGQISSGKSYLASEISKKLDIPIVSFGKYLVNYSRENNLSTERADLQDLGEKFIKQDAEKFLQNVIQYSAPVEDKIIIEGVRHLSIQNAIVNSFNSHYFIFCDTPDAIRYERFIFRNKESDSIKTMESFDNANAHKVEQEIPLLKDRCNFHLTVTDESRSQLYKELSHL